MSNKSKMISTLCMPADIHDISRKSYWPRMLLQHNKNKITSNREWSPGKPNWYERRD